LEEWSVDLGSRLAAAPISWGVCEVPGWGIMLPPARVLDEMASLGLGATELGPTGYLGDSPADVVAVLDDRDLRLVGGFVPLALHDAGLREESRQIATACAAIFAAAGANVFVTAAVVDQAWSSRRPLDDAAWSAFADGLAMVDEICASKGLTQVLHPHVGTLVETADDVQRALEVSDVRWCLDTGHLTIGGVDPVAFAADHADRVAHVHLKDVRAALADDVRAGRFTLLEATRRGVFQPLGQGDVDISGVVQNLERAGYTGWYVLEQDTTLDVAPPPGKGPVADVRVSLAYLASHVPPTPAGTAPAEVSHNHHEAESRA
jgi:inosose dehydratase